VREDWERGKVQIRDKKNFLAGLVLVGFGLGALLIARTYPMGTAFRMGSGYFPAMLASFLIVIGLIVVFLAFRSGEVKLPKVAWRPLIIVSVAVALFGLILKGAGLLLAAFAMVVVSRLARPGYSWVETIVLGVALSVLCTAVFYFGLRIQMPLLPTW
jgi:putative tricarboxylic transport membrane protein